MFAVWIWFQNTEDQFFYQEIKKPMLNFLTNFLLDLNLCRSRYQKSHYVNLWWYHQNLILHMFCFQNPHEFLLCQAKLGFALSFISTVDVLHLKSKLLYHKPVLDRKIVLRFECQNNWVIFFEWSLIWNCGLGNWIIFFEC